jgi:hypothetical protein
LIIAGDLAINPLKGGMTDNHAGLLILAWLLYEWSHRLGIAMQILRTVRLRRLVDRWITVTVFH